MSMLRNVLTYMGLGPDEDYDDGYLYEATGDESEVEIDLTGDEPVLDLRGADAADPHAQRDRPDWLPTPAVAERGTSGERAAAVERSPTPRRKISIDDDDPDDGPWDDDTGEIARPAAGPRPLRAVPPDRSVPVDDAGISVRPATEVDDMDDIDDVTFPQPATEPPGSSLDAPATSDTEPTGSPAGASALRQVRPQILSPRSFGDAKVLADEFKAGVPVVMNLAKVERDLARRLIDFASGICYAVDGGMEKIARQVFLLTPADVDVSEADRRRLDQRDFER